MVTKLDLVKDRAIIRGALWDLLTILRQGDLTAMQCRGQIRDGEDGELFANFEFEPLTTVDIDGVIYTRIKPYLGATRTKQIPTTAPRQTWFYDIELYDPLDDDIVYRIIDGTVESRLNITLP